MKEPLEDVTINININININGETLEKHISVQKTCLTCITFLLFL
jgi:hypothetical protein